MKLFSLLSTDSERPGLNQATQEFGHVVVGTEIE